MTHRCGSCPDTVLNTTHVKWRCVYVFETRLRPKRLRLRLRLDSKIHQPYKGHRPATKNKQRAHPAAAGERVERGLAVARDTDGRVPEPRHLSICSRTN
ncbi:hypothetical protein J6590_011115 [Homalodisca vitripennis]|nr:hypothetical protein J6590_011115 [Homalodisca vitripennis]